MSVVDTRPDDRRREPPEPLSGHCRFEYLLSGPRLRDVRWALARWLEENVPEPRVRHDLVLAASEMCATALATHPPPRSALSLHAWIDGAAVVVEVADGEGDVVSTTARGLAGEADPGLQVVAAVTDVLSVRTGARRLSLRARKERAARV